MSNRTDDHEDRVASALVGESVYERLRYQRTWLFTQPTVRKLRLQSLQLFVLAIGLPLMFGYPHELAATLELDPFSAAPKVAVLGLVGAAITFAAGLALVALAVLRSRLEPMNEPTAESMLAMEEVASLVGFLTGGAAIAITLGFVLLGYGGADAVDAYVGTLGRNPFADTNLNVSAAMVSALAFAGGTTLSLAATALQRLVVTGQ